MIPAIKSSVGFLPMTESDSQPSRLASTPSCKFCKNSSADATVSEIRICRSMHSSCLARWISKVLGQQLHRLKGSRWFLRNFVHHELRSQFTRKLWLGLVKLDWPDRKMRAYLVTSKCDIWPIDNAISLNSLWITKARCGVLIYGGLVCSQLKVVPQREKGIGSAHGWSFEPRFRLHSPLVNS